MGTQKIDIESRKVEEEEEENTFTSKKFKKWFPLGITCFILLICLIITLYLLNFKSYYPEPVPENVPEKIFESKFSKTLKWRFPEADFKSCCSTIDKKQNYLKACNKIFKKEKIECVDVTEGSIIVEFKSNRIDFQEGVFNSLFEVKYIDGHSTENHQKYEIESEPEKAPDLKPNEIQPEPIIDNVKKETVHNYILESKNNVLFLIVNQFLTCKDILLLRETCKFFRNSLQLNQENMVTFYNHGTQEKINTTLIWEDLKYFPKQSDMGFEMFNIKENYYAVLTPENEFIVWNNNITPYPDILEDQAIQYPQYKPNCFGNRIKSSQILNKCESASVKINVNEENHIVTTHGSMKEGGDSSLVQFDSQKIKMIISTDHAFAALLSDGRVVAWGLEKDGGKIPDDIESRLKNVKMVVSTLGAFAALLKDGSVVAWGNKIAGGEIPEPLKNVKMLFSNDRAFVALLEDGNVIAWGNVDVGGQIPNEIQTQLKNVKTISSTKKAFAAILSDDTVVAWGNPNEGGNIPVETQEKLKNVKLIISTNFAFAALLNNGSVHAWGVSIYGGTIPNEIETNLQNVKIIFSTNHTFAALSKDNLFSWWGKNGKSLANVRTVIPRATKFMVVYTNGEPPDIPYQD